MSTRRHACRLRQFYPAALPSVAQQVSAILLGVALALAVILFL